MMKKEHEVQEKNAKAKVRFWEKSLFPKLPINIESPKKPPPRPDTPIIKENVINNKKGK